MELKQNNVRLLFLLFILTLVGCKDTGDILNPDRIISISIHNSDDVDLLKYMDIDSIEINYLNSDGSISPAPLLWEDLSSPFAIRENLGPSTAMLLSANYLGLGEWATTYIKMIDDVDTLECFYSTMRDGELEYIPMVKFNGQEVDKENGHVHIRK